MAQLKTSFQLEKTIDSFYTGGELQLSNDGKTLYCTCGETVHAVDKCSSEKIASYKDDEDNVTCFCLSPNNLTLVTATRNLLLHQFDVEKKVGGTSMRKWKAAHKTPILCMRFDASSTLLATGSSDTTIKIYDTEKQYFTHNLKGSEDSISVVRFHPDQSKLVLFSSSISGKIRMWDLISSKCLSIFSGHFSQVTALEFNTDHSYMISAGRDRVLIIWDLNQRKQLKTIPMFEQIESIISIESKLNETNLDCIVGAGQTGCLRAWSIPDGKCIYFDKNYKNIKIDEMKELTINSVFRLIYNISEKEIIAITYDQNILFYSTDDFKIKKQLIGHLDEIVGLKYFGEKEEYVAIATNSEQLKVIKNETSDSTILYGHTGIILSLDVSFDGKYIASSSKDNIIRVWCKNEATDEFTCVAIGKGHTHWVGCIAWPKTSADFIVTGSADLTLKLWMMPNKIVKSEEVELIVKWTEKAHDKDINAIAVSPNDKLIVSSSQDKFAKVWKRRSGKLVGTLRGHKRGIWCVAFSPVDQCIATGSADSTIKLWALTDFTCVKTLEGHSNSVLQLSFIQRGMQIVSSSSDGLLKLWNVRDDECINTFEAHDDKVWALSVKKTEDVLVTGGGDSSLKYWKDITEQLLLEKTEKEEERILQEQNLQNLLQCENYEEAINSAIILDKPYQVLKIVKDILIKDDGKDMLDDILKKMLKDSLESLLGYLCQWNTNAKHSFPAQTVLASILKLKSPEYLLELSNIKQVVEALLPYTERHYNRVNKLVQQSMFVNYTWETMKLPST